MGILPHVADCYHTNFDIYYHPEFRICEFIAGMITARIFLNYGKQLKYIYVYLLTTLLLIYLGVGALISNNFLNHHKFNHISLDVILLILFPALIYFLSSIKSKVFILLTDNKISDYLGNIAYAFFLTQFLCQFIVRTFLKPNNYLGMNSIELLVISFILNIMLASIMYKFIEMPVSKKLINRFIKK